MRFAIVANGHCRGFVLARRDLWEAFDFEERSLGTFAQEQAAVEAILNYATDALNPNDQAPL